MEDFFYTLTECLEKAGEILLKHFGNLKEIEFKSECNPVTQADKESEAEIIKIITKKFPAHSILAEETGGLDNQKSNYLWIIDPLDGTVNYSHSFPVFSVSIALMVDGEIGIGGVFNPISKEMFLAKKGDGAFLNKKQIRVSKINKIEHALLVTGFPYDRKANIEHYSDIFKEFLRKGLCLRRVGSAALDLCSVACGRMDGFWEEKLNPWDTAAGYLIVEEAGGKVSNFTGGKFDLFIPYIVASNALIHSEMINILKNFIGEKNDKEK